VFELSGKSIIGFQRGDSNSDRTPAINPATREELEPAYHSARPEEVDEAARLASKAFETYARVCGKSKAIFLRKIAENIEGLGDDLVDRATQETALPAPRIKGETDRTCNQLRLFAEMVEDGSWVDARIDRGDPNRTPMPKPDVRSMLQPLGPVVVFCASNFPLAFSVAGGDTASALAAGNPVLVKAHHAHPGTAELVGLAVSRAVVECNLPEGVFSLLYGPGDEVGVQLVKHPLIKAGGFTGSRAGGQALMKLAASRPEPIPFYAEMSSVNPTFILPGVLDEDGEAIASGLHASVILGAGQFCTNPGLVFVPEEGSETLIQKLRTLMTETPLFTMLTSSICSAYKKGVASLGHHSRVELIAGPELDQGPSDCLAGAALFVTDGESFLGDVRLSAEVFGPSTLLIKYSDRDQLLDCARSLEGQLTVTIHATEAELNNADELVGVLERTAGRLIFKGFPTGVEVGPAMVHGGPFPATSDGRSTSVGTRAAFRFTRAVCYQDFVESVLPDELKNANPLGIWRMVDGQMTKASLQAPILTADCGS
jgi:alpha-ketoglutaric semialdehyde dehydrogenase